MAASSFSTGTALGAAGSQDPLVGILYPDKLQQEHMLALWFTNRNMTMRQTNEGEPLDDNDIEAPIVVVDDFKTKRAQRVRLALKRQLTRNRNLASRSTALVAGTYGVGTSLVDSEENLDLYNMEVTVEHFSNAVGFPLAELQEMRTNFHMESMAKSSLSTWAAEQKEEMIVDAIIDGNAAHVIASGLCAAASAHPNSYYAGVGRSATTELQLGDSLNVPQFRRMYNLMMNGPTPSAPVPFAPCKADGEEGFFLLTSSFPLGDLDADSTFRQSLERAGSRSDKNPLFSRYNFKFGGLHAVEYGRTRHPSTGGNRLDVWQLMLLGARAVVLANASRPWFHLRDETAYGIRWGNSIHCICGAARTTFVNTNNVTAGTGSLQQSSAVLNVFSASAI